MVIKNHELNDELLRDTIKLYPDGVFIKFGHAGCRPCNLMSAAFEESEDVMIDVDVRMMPKFIQHVRTGFPTWVYVKDNEVQKAGVGFTIGQVGINQCKEGLGFYTVPDKTVSYITGLLDA